MPYYSGRLELFHQPLGLTQFALGVDVNGEDEKVTNARHTFRVADLRLANPAITAPYLHEKHLPGALVALPRHPVPTHYRPN